MKALLAPLFLLVSCAASGQAPVQAGSAGEGMQPPPSVELHPFLARLVGVWDIRSEMPGGPNGEVVVMQSTESVEALGPWILSSLDAQGDLGVFRARLAMAYDPRMGQFVGNWVDSSSTYMWLYSCSLSADGQTFTAQAEGPSFTDPSRMAVYQDITEFVGDNRRLLRSRVRGDDGKWTEFSSGIAVRRQ